MLVLSVSAAVVVYLHYLIPILYASCSITGDYYIASIASFTAAENAAMQQHANQAYVGYLSGVNGIRLILVGDRIYAVLPSQQCHAFPVP